ncbi:MAG: hypothetical protein ACI837_000013 [Crocinitomicaceae bacterium]|jgi:hypothetical protein
MLNSDQGQSNKRFERILVISLFILLWAYLIIRAFTVFFVHDEIVTKWSFMVDWNPLPDQGFVDANNHFLLSFLGGLFMRIFNSDAMIVLRLAGLLAFPIYFWSIYGLRNLFTQKANFYGMLVGLVCVAFLIEYFGLARGYGLSFAFLMAALQQTTRYLQLNNKMALVGLLVAWILAVYANLTLIPFALIGVIIALSYTWMRGTRKWSIVILLAFIPISYLVNYSFELKALGKLYYGGNEGFFATTIHSITPYLWNVKHVVVDVLLTGVTILIGFVLLRTYSKTKNWFEPRTIFPLFFLLAVGNIFAQHWFLDINYPEDRTALYIVIFFVGALFFTLDSIWKHSWFAIVYSLGTVILFCVHFNFSHSTFYYGEHIDRKMVEMIPNEVKGTPPTTGGRWSMENEMNRTLDLPLRAFQEINSEADTLVDYMIYSVERWPGIHKWYRPLYTDKISGQTLFERKHFLNRTKTDESSVAIGGKNEFQVIHETGLKSAMMLRCSGTLKKMHRYNKDVYVVFTSKDTLTGAVHTYDALSFMQNMKASSTGEIHFDFTYAMKLMPGANLFSVYVWNKKSAELDGKLKLEVYSIDD